MRLHTAISTVACTGAILLGTLACGSSASEADQTACADYEKAYDDWVGSSTGGSDAAGDRAAADEMDAIAGAEGVSPEVADAITQGTTSIRERADILAGEAEDTSADTQIRVNDELQANTMKPLEVCDEVVGS